MSKKSKSVTEETKVVVDPSSIESTPEVSTEYEDVPQEFVETDEEYAARVFEESVREVPTFVNPPTFTKSEAVDVVFRALNKQYPATKGTAEKVLTQLIEAGLVQGF